MFRNGMFSGLLPDADAGAYPAEMHVACQRGAFTLIEVVAVVAILAILMSFIFPTIHSARRSARQADCRSNLRQFGIALTVYRADHAGRNPDWMSNLYPKYIDSKNVYVCKSDARGGEGPLVPNRLRDTHSVSLFLETVDNSQVKVPPGESRGTRHPTQNTDITANSYFYEFSAAECSWRPGKSWSEAKEEQLRLGDSATGGGTIENPVPYSASRMPIIRCWHHWSESKISGYVNQAAKNNNTLSHLPLTLNVAYAGNVLVAPPWWEGSLDPGD